jgi:hypothetical protein
MDMRPAWGFAGTTAVVQAEISVGTLFRVCQRRFLPHISYLAILPFEAVESDLLYYLKEATNK